MVSITAAPLRFGAGVIRSSRVVPVSFRISAGEVAFTKGTQIGASLGVLNLNRLTEADRLAGENPAAFQRRAAIWQSNCDATEDAFAAINARVDELEAIVARLTAAEELAQVANDNAATAASSVATVTAAVATTFEAVDPTYRGIFENAVEP